MSPGPRPGLAARISNGSFRVGGPPGFHPGAFSAVPTGLISVDNPTHYVLGYSQPELSKLAEKRRPGRRNVLNGLKSTRANENWVGCCCADSVHPPPQMPRVGH